jgi:putative peptidoglycan lipid II flippase
MFRSTLVVSLLAAFVSSISFLNQLILARFFGATSEMDAYLLAISLPLTISGLLAGVLGYQLVPALQRAKSGLGDGDALMNSLAWGLGGIAAIIALLGAADAAWLIRVMNPSISFAQHALATNLARIAWLYLPLAVLSAIYTAGLHIRRHFTTATILTAAPIAGSMITCLVAHARLGVSTAVWGQLFGYIVMLGGLRLAYGASRASLNWTGLGAILAQLPLAGAASIIFLVYPFSDAIWGSHIGPSAISYLGYAQRLLVGFSGLAVIGATTVIFPRLASKAAQGEHHSMRQDLGLSLRVMLVCMTPAAVLFGVLVLPTLQVLFQRGAFNLADARSLARLLPFMLVGMTAMSCMGLVFKALFADSDVRAAAVISVFGAVTYFVLSGLFSTTFGLVGIGAAYALSWWLALGLSLRHLWHGELEPATVRSNYKFALRLAAGAALTAGIGWLGTRFLPPEDSTDNLHRLLVLVATGFSAAGTYLVIGNGPLAIPEVRLLTKQLLALAKRG